MTVRDNSAAFMATVTRAASIGVVEGANIVRNEAIELVRTTPKTGRTYRRRGVVHQASAPGEPYASDTGATLGQISEPELDADGLTARVMFRSENAKRLELGTEKMEPRPVAAPALRNRTQDVEDAIRSELAKALKT